MERRDRMTIMTKTVIDTQANTETVVEMTAEEIAQLTAIREKALADLAEQEAANAVKETLKASARLKLVSGEPLTEEEAATIVL